MKLLVGFSKGKGSHVPPQDVISCCSNPSVSAARVLSASRFALCFFVHPLPHMHIDFKRIPRDELWILLLLHRQNGLNAQRASPKCFCILVWAVNGLSEMLYQREDNNTNHLSSKRLFPNYLWTSKAKHRASSRWIFSTSPDLRQFKKQWVTDTTGNCRTTTTSCSPVTHNPRGVLPGGAFWLTEWFTSFMSDKLRSRSLSVAPAAAIIALSAELRIPEWTEHALENWGAC